MKYLTVKEAGKKWEISGRMVTYYCVGGRIKGAVKKGNLWLVPSSSEKPFDGRRNKNIKNKRLTKQLKDKEEKCKL